MRVSESSENYLETILILSKKLPVVRSVDISNELGFKKSSVSVAMKNLKEKHYITVTDAGFIYLTEDGNKIAQTIYERHEFISKWLMSLGVDEVTATEDACRIEHVISPESFEAIKNHVKMWFVMEFNLKMSTNDVKLEIQKEIFNHYTFNISTVCALAPRRSFLSQVDRW